MIETNVLHTIGIIALQNTLHHVSVHAQCHTCSSSCCSTLSCLHAALLSAGVRERTA